LGGGGWVMKSVDRMEIMDRQKILTIFTTDTSLLALGFEHRKAVMASSYSSHLELQKKSKWNK